MTLRIPKRYRISPSHARAKVQEKECAERIGGKITPGSGSKNQKGDVRKWGIVRVENKTTKHKSFSVSTELLEKLDAAVFGTSEIPMFEIELGLGTHRACVLPGYALDLIVELLEVHHGSKS